MIVNCLTLFPGMFDNFLGQTILARAEASGVLRVNCIDFRAFTADRHGRVDDYPFGGAPGMLLSPQPLFDCFEAIAAQSGGARTRNIYMSPAGRVLRAEDAARLAEEYEIMNVLCGHYEGVDQRVLDAHIDEEISIGDYVLTGGELPAMVLIDSVARFVPGVLGNGNSAADDSFQDGLLEAPQYTRPSEFRGLRVPDVLLSGNHAAIQAWKHQQAWKRTNETRPDLLAQRKGGE